MSAELYIWQGIGVLLDENNFHTWLGRYTVWNDAEDDIESALDFGDIESKIRTKHEGIFIGRTQSHEDYTDYFLYVKRFTKRKHVYQNEPGFTQKFTEYLANDEYTALFDMARELGTEKPIIIPFTAIEHYCCGPYSTDTDEKTPYGR